MNLAIIIGVSQYDKEKQLPGCKNDAIFINGLLESSNKYKEILFITEETKSNLIMDKIDDFVNKHSSDKVEELLFYFSGHGTCDNNDFYYCSSEVDITKLNSTSIKNGNLDSIIKKLCPNTYVKIIDACNSGNLYIKGELDRKSIFEKNSGSFRNCYFFSSSEKNQSSFANEYISYFTKSFFEILKQLIIEDKITSVKYRNLSAALADEYNQNKDQTPFFVEQGSLSEVFLDNNQKIKEFLDVLKLDVKQEINDKQSINTIAPIDNFIPSSIEAIKTKDDLIIDIEHLLKSDNDDDVLFKYSYNSSFSKISENNIFNKYKIGTWILENKEKIYIFAKEKECRKRSKNTLFNISSMLSYNDEDIEYEISGFKLNVDEENSIYEVVLDSQQYLPKYCCQLVFIYSLTKIYILYDFSYAYSKNWEEYEDYHTSDKVNIISFKIKDESKLKENSKKIVDEFKQFCIKNLNEYLEVLFKEN